jgi:hypothetical protein
MKKQFFTLMLFCAPVFLFAQGVGIGIKGGANFANLESTASTSSITSYHVGAYVNFNLSDKWGITPEVLWSAQGAEIEDAKFKTDYVLVPVLLRYKIISLISIEAGPQFNILSSAKYDGDDIKDQLNSSTYSVVFGATAHLPLGFNGGLRYTMGMSDLSDIEGVELKDRTVQIFVGWTIFGAK